MSQERVMVFSIRLLTMSSWRALAKELETVLSMMVVAATVGCWQGRAGCWQGRIGCKFGRKGELHCEDDWKKGEGSACAWK